MNMKFVKLIQTSVNGDCLVVIALESHEAREVLMFTDDVVHQYASNAMRSVGFKSPETVTDWRLTQIIKRGQTSAQATLEVEYQ